MNRNWLYYLLIFCCCSLFSCSQKKEVPLTIPEEQWVEILLDAHLLEATLQEVKGKSRDTMKLLFYSQLYEIYGITEKKFIENIEIMEIQPEMLARVYNKVMEEVSKLEAEGKEVK